MLGHSISQSIDSFDGWFFSWSVHRSVPCLVGPSVVPFAWFRIQTVPGPLVSQSLDYLSSPLAGLSVYDWSVDRSLLVGQSVQSFGQSVRVFDGSFVGQFIGLSLGCSVLLLVPLLGSSLSRSLSSRVSPLIFSSLCELCSSVPWLVRWSISQYIGWSVLCLIGCWAG